MEQEITHVDTLQNAFAELITQFDKGGEKDIVFENLKAIHMQLKEISEQLSKAESNNL